MILFALLPITIYTAIYIKYKGIPDSFSETYRGLPDRLKPLFGITLALTVLPIMLVTLKPLFIVSGVLISLVGANPNYWEEKGFEDETHFICAIGGIVVGYIGLIVHYTTWTSVIVTALFAVAYYLLNKAKNHTLWQELIAVYIIVIGLTL